MAIPKPDPGDWLRANAQELRVGDREVLAMLRDSYRRVNELLDALVAKDSPNVSDNMRRAQLETSRSKLLAEQARVFERLGEITAARRARSASRAARLSAAGNAELLRKVGRGAEGQYLYEAALQVSQRAIDVALARMRLSELPLSERIYRSSVWMGGRLGKLINETLASGLNAREFAKRARDWFNPNTPGGVRFAAMRLARTEINNAFHAITAQKAQETPWIPNCEWHLSGSHPTPDECNTIAERDNGFGEGVYRSEDVPVRPHPQCMCYITPKPIDEDDFVENFLKGDYDDYLDEELEKNGWDVKDPPKPVERAAEQSLTPRNVFNLRKKSKAGIEVKDRAGTWIEVGAIEMGSGGGSRSGGARGAQWTFRDQEGLVIREAAGSEHVPVREITSKPDTTKVPKSQPERTPAAKPVPAPKPEAVKRVDEFVVGEWQLQTSNDLLIRETADNLKKAQPSMTDDEALALATKFIEGTADENEIRLRNGPHEVRFTGSATEEERKAFLGYVDLLQSRFPTGHNMNINVAPPTEFDYGVGGETTLSTGYVRINERTLRQKIWASGMPISSRVASALYVLAHEWGHALSTKDEADDQHTHDHALESGGMTKYGSKDHRGKKVPREGYAEAFAEWALSEGKTTNPAALVYAEKFHWGERFGF